MKFIKKLSGKTRTLVIVMTVFLFSFLSWSFDQYFEISKNLDIFTSIYQEVNTSYVDDVESGELMRTAIDAMLESLDPYTNYFSESQTEDFRIEMSGQYSGIGAKIIIRDGYIVLDELYENSPAVEADLRTGDVLLEVDGKNMKGKNSDDVSKALKGQASTKVKLKIKREGAGELEKEITRRDIKVLNVPYYGMIDSRTGYIKLVGFTNNASDEVANALKELKKNPGMKQLVLDLRGNGGGLLHEAVNIVNIFVDKGELVVSTKGRLKEWDKEYHALNAPVDKEIPLVVLVDKGSASASEIVSGTLQDLDRAVIIGTKSFGKGLVQSTRPLKYGTQLKVTTAKYYTPSGRCIQKIDYSNKVNGRGTLIADSLRKGFKTKNGRKVYDATGIWPDVPVDHSERSNVAAALLSRYLIFDYGTKYRNSHDKIPAARDFRLTDAEFQDFVNFLKDKTYSYNTDTEDALEELKKEAESEKYFSAIEAEYQALKKKLSHDKEADLMKNKEEIRQLLEEDISRRYYYQKAHVETNFDNDTDITAALKTFSDMNHYSSILKGTAKN